MEQHCGKNFDVIPCSFGSLWCLVSCSCSRHGMGHHCGEIVDVFLAALFFFYSVQCHARVLVMEWIITVVKGLM